MMHRNAHFRTPTEAKCSFMYASMSTIKHVSIHMQVGVKAHANQILGLVACMQQFCYSHAHIREACVLWLVKVCCMLCQAVCMTAVMQAGQTTRTYMMGSSSSL